MYQHLLIATDGSELAEKAVEHGLAVAKGLGARITVVTVTEPGSAMLSGDMGLAMGIAFPSEEYARAAAAGSKVVLDKVAAAAARAGVPCEVLHVADRFPAEAIIDVAATHGCDLIVMSSHGRRGLSRVLLGSQTSKVLSHSSVPVLVVR